MDEHQKLGTNNDRVLWKRVKRRSDGELEVFIYGKMMVAMPDGTWREPSEELFFKTEAEGFHWLRGNIETRR